jgi:hypothetical protein
MRTWLRRWLGLEGREDTKVITRLGLDRRVLELESHVDWMHGELRKLRGRVTGAIRREELHPDPDGGNGDRVSDAPPVASTGFDRQYELAQLERSRHAAIAAQIKGEP